MASVALFLYLRGMRTVLYFIAIVSFLAVVTLLAIYIPKFVEYGLMSATVGMVLFICWRLAIALSEPITKNDN